MQTSEKLEIEAGGDLITIEGWGLKRLLDALREERLAMVQEQGEIAEDVPMHEIHVRFVSVDERV